MPEQDNALKVIQRASERLERLIEDLIAFSSASREGLQLKLQPVGLPGLLRGVVVRSAEKATKAGVQLNTDIADGLPPVRADAERLAWALFQLVDNGIKFTPAGGSVTVEAHPQSELVTVSIRDTGIGIPADRQSEIFEPFHQLDGSTTRRYGGTGLGLAMVRLILEAHATAVQVQSTEGAGSTFSFSFPAGAEIV